MAGLGQVKGVRVGGGVRVGVGDGRGVAVTVGLGISVGGEVLVGIAVWVGGGIGVLVGRTVVAVLVHPANTTVTTARLIRKTSLPQP